MKHFSLLVVGLFCILGLYVAGQYVDQAIKDHKAQVDAQGYRLGISHN